MQGSMFIWELIDKPEKHNELRTQLLKKTKAYRDKVRSALTLILDWIGSAETSAETDDSSVNCGDDDSPDQGALASAAPRHNGLNGARRRVRTSGQPSRNGAHASRRRGRASASKA
jgi:hypothetical protein